ncbi:hypothetical protein [Helicobacter rodentium]|uniref:hypothetical protein n=1 Tax=Helicobacter rodentium TaxID=59617 RepID=UPI000AB5DFED|nr:hypothetical protein [Helicobacter rodentium]
MDIYFLCDFLAIIQNFGIFTQFALLSLRDSVLAESWQSTISHTCDSTTSSLRSLVKRL